MTEALPYRPNPTAERFGLKPKKDSATGLYFYLWDDMFRLDAECHPEPRFGAQETGKVFFGRGADWLRWRYHSTVEFPKGYFTIGRVVLNPKRTESGQRYYTLADIERMAHALARNHAIESSQIEVITSICLEIARLYRYV